MKTLNLVEKYLDFVEFYGGGGGEMLKITKNLERV